MKATKVKWLWWAGGVLFIAYDVLIGIPPRAFIAILIVGFLLAIIKLEKQLEEFEQKSRDRLDTLAKRLDEINNRLRWVESKLFGKDNDDILSEEWSARHSTDE